MADQLETRTSSVRAPSTPDLEGAREAWDAAEREQVFWQEHYRELLQQYPDQFVAVRDGQVVAAHPDLQPLLKKLKHQGIDPTHAWVHYLATDPRRLML
jgi:hypothetical protein